MTETLDNTILAQADLRRQAPALYRELRARDVAGTPEPGDDERRIVLLPLMGLSPTEHEQVVHALREQDKLTRQIVPDSEVIAASEDVAEVKREKAEHAKLGLRLEEKLRAASVRHSTLSAHDANSTKQKIDEILKRLPWRILHPGEAEPTAKPAAGFSQRFPSSMPVRAAEPTPSGCQPMPHYQNFQDGRSSSPQV